MGLDVKPFIIVIVENESDIVKVYIHAADNIMYEIPSFSIALYVLFQIYIVLRLPYPVESVKKH